jgi:hypothetical protein
MLPHPSDFPGTCPSLTTTTGDLIHHPNSIFIVITPLVALNEEMSCCLASTTIIGRQYHHMKDVLSAQIVIVSAHQAGMDDFSQWATSMCHRLRQAFINEAHHAFTSDNDWACFKVFYLMTCLKIPITFLTVTMSLQSLSRLYAEMQIPPNIIHIIKALLH